PVVAEPGAPVQVRLEHREPERARRVEADGVDGESAQTEPGRHPVRPQPCALAHSERREPENGHRDRGRKRECYQRDEHERRAARGGLEPIRERARLCERIGQPTGDEHQQRHGARPGESAFHLTCSVNGAVRIRPRSWNWRKSRQVPATGSSTPTLSFPGPAGRPTTLAPPKMLVQPGVFGPQTWVWKYSSVAARKKIACASAPNHGWRVTS